MIFALSYSLANFVLYCVQQLGVSLGVGASTILLVAYLQAQRDREVDDQEKGFALAVRRVMDFGLFCMIVSGIGIVAIQIMQGQSIAVFSTAFIFKWSLMGVVLFMAVANRGSSLASEVFQGIAGGTWYAIFVIHILAPEAELLDLAIFYGAWLVGFMICWTMMVFAFRGKKGAVPIPARVQTVPPLRPSPNFTAPPTPVAPQVVSDITVTTSPVVEQKKGFFGSLFASKSKIEEPITPSAPQPIAVQLAPRLAPVTPPPSPSVQVKPMQAPVPPPPRPTMQPPVQMQKPVPPPSIPATPITPPATPIPPSAPVPPPPPMASVPVPPPAPIAPAPMAAPISMAPVPPPTSTPRTQEPMTVLSQAPVMHVSVAPLPPAEQPAAFKGLNVMPKNPQDIEKRNTI